MSYSIIDCSLHHRAFTVPFPTLLFLSSITCPVPHLFACSFIQGPSSLPCALPFARAVNPRAGVEAGARKEVGGWRETWEMQRDPGMPILPCASVAYVHLTLVCRDVPRIWLSFCLFVCAYSLAHEAAACLPNLLRHCVQTRAHLGMHIKRTHSYTLLHLKATSSSIAC